MEGPVEQAEPTVAVSLPKMGVGVYDGSGSLQGASFLMDIAAIEGRVGGHEHRCARQEPGQLKRRRFHRGQAAR